MLNPYKILLNVKEQEIIFTLVQTILRLELVFHLNLEVTLLLSSSLGQEQPSVKPLERQLDTL